MNFPAVGRVSCYAYVYSQWTEEIVRLVLYVVATVTMHIHGGQGSQLVRYTQMYSVGHALFKIEPSPQLTWYDLYGFLAFFALNNQIYTPGTFLFAVTDCPSGDWSGALTD